MSRSIWELDFNDGVSPEIAKMVRNVNSAFGNISQKEAALQQTMNNTAVQVNKNNTLFKELATTVGSLFAVSQLYSWGEQIFRIGAGVEQTNIAYSVLLGSQEKANQKIKEMKQFADVTPFNTQEVLSAGKSLLGFGLEAEKLLPIMNMLGDASMGNSNSFQSLVDNYGKMVGAQRANTVDLNQFAIAGVPIWREVGKIVGLTGQELRKYVETNGVSLDIIDNAFKNLTQSGGQFFGMMDKQSQSTIGLWSTFTSKVEDSATKIFNKLQPFANTILQLATDYLPKLEYGLSVVYNLLPEIALAVGSVTIAWGVYNGLLLYTNTILPLASLLMSGQITLLGLAQGAWWGLNAAIMANPFAWIAGLIGALVAGLVYAWNKFEGFRKFLFGLWESVKTIFGGIADVIASALTFDFENVYKVISEFPSKIASAWSEGNEKGAASFQASKSKAQKEGNSNLFDSNASKYSPALPLATSGGSGSSGGSSSSGGGTGSGGGVRNVNVTIQQLVGKIEIVSNNVMESSGKIKEMVAEALVAAVRDTELSIN